MALEFNLDQFNKDLDRQAKDATEGELLKLQKQIAFDLLFRVIEKTPVDTGRARGAWVVGLGTPSGSQGTPSKAGFGPATKGKQIIDSAKPFGVIWISNNVEYIDFLEEGTSAQAPNGFLAVSIEETRLSFP